jgi:hypothetical protein
MTALLGDGITTYIIPVRIYLRAVAANADSIELWSSHNREDRYTDTNGM